MPTINLKKHYPHIREDTFIDVSDEIYEVILLSIRQENNYNARTYYHKAYYSLNCDDGIENEALHRMSSPEEILMQQVMLEQLDVALQSIPKIQAERIYQHYILGKKKVQISKDNGVSNSSICNSIKTGLENLHKQYIKRKFER